MGAKQHLNGTSREGTYVQTHTHTLTQTRTSQLYDPVGQFIENGKYQQKNLKNLKKIAKNSQKSQFFFGPFFKFTIYI